jgi:hypothetical protein
MTDPKSALNRRLTNKRFKIGDSTHASTSLKNSIVPQKRYPRTVVTAVLQTIQSLQQKICGVRFPDIANNATHEQTLCKIPTKIPTSFRKKSGQVAGGLPTGNYSKPDPKVHLKTAFLRELFMVLNR